MPTFTTAQVQQQYYYELISCWHLCVELNERLFCCVRSRCAARVVRSVSVSDFARWPRCALRRFDASLNSINDNDNDNNIVIFYCQLCVSLLQSMRRCLCC